MRTLEEFMKKVDKPEGDGCWLWMGGKHGSINWQGKVEPVRRVAWKIQKGEIGGSCRIGTSCKNQLCVRPEHLTKKDVAEDKPKLQKAVSKPRKLPKVPTVVLDNPKLTTLLQELVSEADKVEKKCDRALVMCHKAYALFDEILIKLSESRDRTEDIAGKAISLYKDEEFRDLAKEGWNISDGRK